uniref:solute carrier family 35 member D3 n=1 Tax=Monopterus albus TaxID=43700 RepID=UPI0009B2EF34|nr:solute carrier family 35 member D3 [Monopterus albus]
MDVFRSRMLGISVAVAHGVFSGSLNILLKFLITSYHFTYLTLIQFLTSSTAALTLETLRRMGKVEIPPFSLQLSKVKTVWCSNSNIKLYESSHGSKGPHRLFPPGAGDLTGDPFGYVTGVLAVIIHASYLVLIQKTSLDSEYGPLTAQYAIAIMASPVLLVCAFISMDAINMWSYEGWKDPHITVIFILCTFIGCAMNFTTLHCTYINSAVTTSFVGVVKSIATITVGMLAFSDVAPTRLFIAGVVVNTVGSITYCVVKYFEMKKKSLYEDLEEGAKDGALPGEPYREKPPLNGDGSDPGNPEIEGVLSSDGQEEALANGQLWTGDGGQGHGEAGINSHVMTEKEVLEVQREHLHRENTPTSRQSLSDSYVGVWRSIRHLQFMKKDPLIDNMEQQSP